MNKYTLILWFLTVSFWGITPFIEKIGLKDANPVQALFIRTFSALIGIFFITLITSSFKFFSLSWKSVWILSLSGITGGFLGMLTYFTLLKTKEASQVVPLTSTYPLITTILAIVFLKEDLNFFKALGIIFIVIGIYLIFKS